MIHFLMSFLTFVRLFQNLDTSTKQIFFCSFPFFLYFLSYFFFYFTSHPTTALCETYPHTYIKMIIQVLHFTEEQAFILFISLPFCLTISTDTTVTYSWCMLNVDTLQQKHRNTKAGATSAYITNIFNFECSYVKNFAAKNILSSKI